MGPDIVSKKYFKYVGLGMHRRSLFNVVFHKYRIHQKRIWEMVEGGGGGSQRVGWVGVIGWTEELDDGSQLSEKSVATSSPNSRLKSWVWGGLGPGRGAEPSGGGALMIIHGRSRMTRGGGALLCCVFEPFI